MMMWPTMLTLTMRNKLCIMRRSMQSGSQAGRQQQHQRIRIARTSINTHTCTTEKKTIHKSDGWWSKPEHTQSALCYLTLEHTSRSSGARKQASNARLKASVIWSIHSVLGTMLLTGCSGGGLANVQRYTVAVSVRPRLTSIWIDNETFFGACVIQNELKLLCEYYVNGRASC